MTLLLHLTEIFILTSGDLTASHLISTTSKMPSIHSIVTKFLSQSTLGTDIVIESDEITLIKGDLNGILKAYKLSKGTMKNIRQNLFFAFIYNTAGVPIAAGILYPFFGILLSPIIAAAAMSFSSVSVIANSLRLKGMKL